MPVGPTGFIPPSSPLPSWLPPGVPMSPAQFPASTAYAPTFAQIQAQMAGNALPYAAPTPPPAQMFARPGFTPPQIRPDNSLDLLGDFATKAGQKRQMQLAAQQAVNNLAVRPTPQWVTPQLTSGSAGALTAAPPTPPALSGAPSINPNAARALRSGFGVPQAALPSMSRGLPSLPTSVPFVPESGVGAGMARAGIGSIRGPGQFGTAIGVPSAAPGVRGTLSRSMLSSSAGGKIGGVVKGGVAGLIGGGLRNRILDGGVIDGKVLTNESPGERLARAGTLGLAAGVPFGPAGALVGALGVGGGQAAVEMAASDNPILRGLTGALPMFAEATGNPLQGRTGDELSVAHALGKVPGVGQFLGDQGPSTIDQFQKILSDQVAPQVAQQAQERQAAAANPATISDLARRMGMDEDAAGELGNSWAQQVEQYRVMAENGALDIEVPDPANPGKTIRRPVTADELPGFIENQFRQTITQLPEIIAEGNAARKAQEADAAAQQEALTRAFGYSVAMNQLMAPDYDRMASNPLMAPYAGLMRQSNLNLPYLIAHDQYKDTQAQYAAEQRQIAQQEAAARRAYEMELAKLKAKQDAEAAAGELGVGSVASILK